MTLIIAVEAANCMVMAADSLTTVRDRVVSCDTLKIHQVSVTDVAAGAGASRIQGRYWSENLPVFLDRWAGPGPAQTAPDLKRFLDAEIEQVDPKNFGACAGGNTFLIAGPTLRRVDPTSVRRATRRRPVIPAGTPRLAAFSDPDLVDRRHAGHSGACGFDDKPILWRDDRRRGGRVRRSGDRRWNDVREGRWNQVDRRRLRLLGGRLGRRRQVEQEGLWHPLSVRVSEPTLGRFAGARTVVPAVEPAELSSSDGCGWGSQ